MIIAPALLFSTLFSPVFDDIRADERADLCDDGSPPQNRYGRINWSCTVNGCPPNADVCWEDRLDHCFDSSGKDLGVCNYLVSSCDSIASCLAMWFNCTGTWNCNKPTKLACKSGTCTIADAPSPECVDPDDTWQFTEQLTAEAR